MDDYVAVEAYDVMLGATAGAGGSQWNQGNHAANAEGGATASWDLETGITGKGWTLSGFDYTTFQVVNVDVYGTTDDEIRAKVIPYLNTYGNAYVSTIGCV